MDNTATEMRRRTESAVLTAYSLPTEVDAQLDKDELIRFRKGMDADILVKFVSGRSTLRTWDAHKFVLSRSNLLAKLCKEGAGVGTYVRMGVLRVGTNRKDDLSVLEISVLETIQFYEDGKDIMDALLVFIYTNGLEPTVANRIGASFASIVGLGLVAAEAGLSGLAKLAASMLQGLCTTRARNTSNSTPDRHPSSPNDSPEVADFCRAVRLAYDSRLASICTIRGLLAEFAFATRDTLKTSDNVVAVLDEFPDFEQKMGSLCMGMDKPIFNLSSDVGGAS